MSVRSIVQMVDDAVDLPYVLPPLLGTGASASPSGSGSSRVFAGSASP